MPSTLLAFVAPPVRSLTTLFDNRPENQPVALQRGAAFERGAYDRESEVAAGVSPCVAGVGGAVIDDLDVFPAQIGDPALGVTRFEWWFKGPGAPGICTDPTVAPAPAVTWFSLTSGVLPIDCELSS